MYVIWQAKDLKIHFAKEDMDDGKETCLTSLIINDLGNSNKPLYLTGMSKIRDRPNQDE